MNWILLKIIEYLHSLFNTVFFFKHIYVQCFFLNIATLSSGDGSGAIFVPTLTVFVEAFQIFPVSYPVPPVFNYSDLRWAEVVCILFFTCPYWQLLECFGFAQFWSTSVSLCQFCSIGFLAVFSWSCMVCFSPRQKCRRSKDSNSTEDQLRRSWFSPRDIWLGFALKEWKRPYETFPAEDPLQIVPLLRFQFLPPVIKIASSISCKFCSHQMGLCSFRSFSIPVPSGND